MKLKNLVMLLISVMMALAMTVPAFAVNGAQKIVISGKKTVNKGKTIKLDSEIFPDNVDIPDSRIVWKSSNSKVAKVLRTHDEDTGVKGMKAGTATISVTVSGTNIQASCKVTIKKGKSRKSGASAAKKKIQSYKKQAKRADFW